MKCQIIGESPSGKAPDFDSGIRRFDPYLPSQLKGVVSLGRLRPFLFKGSMVSDDSLMVFTGNANPKLAQFVVQHLNIQLGRATVGRFSDGEVMIEILDNVRG